MIVTLTNYADFKTLASNTSLLGALLGPMFYLFAGGSLLAWAFSSTTTNVVVASISAANAPTPATFTADFPLAHLLNASLTLSP